MRRHPSAGVLALLFVLGPIAGAFAQQVPRQSFTNPLTERLEAFRQSLLGDFRGSTRRAPPSQNPTRGPGNTRRQTAVAGSPVQGANRSTASANSAGRGSAQPFSSSRRRPPSASAQQAGANTASRVTTPNYAPSTATREIPSLQQRVAARFNDSKNGTGEQTSPAGMTTQNSPTAAEKEDSSRQAQQTPVRRTQPQWQGSAENKTVTRPDSEFRRRLELKRGHDDDLNTGEVHSEDTSDVKTVTQPSDSPTATQEPSFSLSEELLPEEGDDSWLESLTANKPEPVTSGNTSVATTSSSSSARTATDKSLQPAQQPMTEIVEKPTLRGNSPRSNVLVSRNTPVLGVELIGPDTVTVGKTATYTVKLRNTGDVEARGVAVTMLLPAWTDLVEARPSSGSVPIAPRAAVQGEEDYHDPLTWRVDQIGARSEETLQIRLTPRKSLPFDLAVQCTVQPVRTQAMVDVREARLNLSISGSPEINYGDKRSYRLTLSNPGNGNAENVVVNVLVGEGDDQTDSGTFDVLKAGESKVIELELEAREAGTLMIRAEATADGGLRAQVAEQVLVRRAGLHVMADAPEKRFASTVAGYRLRVHNPGNAVAEEVRVAAALPPGAEFISASAAGKFNTDENQVAWNLGSLRPGADAVFEVRCVLHRPGTSLFRFGAMGKDNLSATGSTTTEVEAVADLKLEVKDPLGPVAVGDEAIYEIRVRNRGTKAAENVQVFAYFSKGVEPIAVDGANAQIQTGAVEFDSIPLLEAGGETLLRVRARAEFDGNHDFQAQVECEPLGIRLSATETTRFYDGTGLASEELDDAWPEEQADASAEDNLLR